MEKGEVRFAGPTAELLERDDILRSVFLEGAGVGRRRRQGAGGGRRRRPGAPAPTARAAAVLEPSTITQALRRHPRRRRRRASSCTRARSSGSSGRTAPARRRCSTSSPASSPADGGRVAARRRRRHRRGARPPGVGRARPLVPGRPPVPVAHRRREHRHRRSSATSSVRDPLAAVPRPARRARARSDVAWTRRTTSSSCMRPRRVPRQVRRRAVDRHAAHRRPRHVHRATSPTVLLLDEPSSGIAQRETEALGPLLRRIQARDRLRHARDRARHAADHRDLATASSPSSSAG